MKVFVTGATGFVGEELVRQLHQAGHSLRLLARHPTSPRVQALVSQYGAEAYPGDVVTASSLHHALDNMEAVIHLVGIISEVGQSTFENIHTRGTEHLVAAAQKAGIQRFIHMSALGTRPNASSRYHQTKWAAEEAVRHSPLAYTIFRPSLIYGRHDHFVHLFAQVIRRSPFVPLIGNGQARFQPVSVEMVATAFVRALSQPKAIGQTYDLVGPEVFT
ncbi:MAG TPA: complex I NDUFA9 subunit family protein, partial [Candidatus Sulfotelmatobacter sp.]|nr:complex I NDUFA9 subunit family protein [Candidatus Sulfotelmatobacter sp.]